MTKYDYFDVNILIILWFWISAVSCLQEGKKTEGKYQGKVISIHFEHDAIYIFLKLFLLYHNHFNARALIGQSAMDYCAGKPMEKSRVF